MRWLGLVTCARTHTALLFSSAIISNRKQFLSQRTVPELTWHLALSQPVVAGLCLPEVSFSWSWRTTWRCWDRNSTAWWHKWQGVASLGLPSLSPRDRRSAPDRQSVAAAVLQTPTGDVSEGYFQLPFSKKVLVPPLASWRDSLWQSITCPAYHR